MVYVRVPNDVRSVYSLPVGELLLPEFVLQSLGALIALLYLAGAQAHPGVIDEHIDMLLVLADFFEEVFDRRLVRDVRRHRDELAARVEERLAPRLRGLFKNLGAAAGDVYARAVVGECLRDHEADACAAAGDNADPTLDVEEARRREFCVSGCHGCVRTGCDSCG